MKYLTIKFGIDRGVIKDMELVEPRLTLKEIEEGITEEARLWRLFGSLMGADLTKLRELLGG